MGDEETSVRQIADAVRELVAEVPLVHGPERPVDVRLARISGERAAAELGWRPATAFADGLLPLPPVAERDRRLARLVEGGA